MSASCETTITYNGVTLSDVLTESINCTIQRNSTGVDPIGIRTTITVVAMAHTSSTPIHGVQVPWSSPASIAPGLRTVIDKLMLPRRWFRMQVGGKTLYNILPSAVEPGNCNPTSVSTDYLTQDIEHGPWVDVTVLAIRGQTTAKCRFTFRFMTPICGDPTNLNDVINLRYWIADDIDCSSWLTTRRYEGTFRVRARDATINPHLLARQLTLPPVQPGFRRSKITWSESPDGLTFNFSITDVEQWAHAPSPATDWDGTYSLSIPQGEVCAEADLTFRLIGDKNTDKRYLFKLAQRIIDYKLHYAELIQQDTKALLMHQVWHEDLKDNEVGASLRIKYVGAQWIDFNLPVISTTVGPSFDLGLPLPKEVSDFVDNPKRKLYDKEIATGTDTNLPTATIHGLFVCALQTDCCTQELHQAEQIQQSSFQLTYDDQQSSSQLATVNQEERDTRFSDEHLEAPYIWYKLTNRYREDTGWRAFPLGKQCVSSSSDDTVAFSRLHCSVATREVLISACRVDKWPSLPERKHWQDNATGVKFVLKDREVHPSTVQLTADGKHELREASARYLYLMSRPFTDNESLPVGNPPHITSLPGINGNIVPPEAYVETSIILGAGS